MATAPTTKKRRRPGQACDSCHRKKTRCYWRAPACADCIRLKVPCTFQRTHPPVSTDEPPQTVRGQDREDSELGRHEVDRSDTLASTPHEETTLLSARNGEQAIDLYFNEINHTFPILSRRSFSAWSSEASPDDPAFKTCLKSLLCSALQHVQLSGTNADGTQRHLYWDCLAEALSNLGNLLISAPPLRTVQALTSLVACVQRTVDGAEKGLPILAVAIRFACRLNLHHLDEDEGIGADDRLERLRLFWCLYILDRSTSLRMHLPPIINDEDLYVLRPKMFSDDSLGLVHAVKNSSVLNLFAARHRLATISGALWASLYTFHGSHQPISAQREAQESIQRRLLDWKLEWFYADYPNIEWPANALVGIAHLQFEWFYCLLKADPETFPPSEPKSASLMGDESPYMKNLRANVQVGTAPWVDAARETLRLAGVVRKGGLNYIQYASHYIVPAILILSAASSSGHAVYRQHAESDRELTRLWLELFGHIAKRGVDNEWF